MADKDTPLFRVLGALPGDQPPKKSGASYMARCPAHEDQHASLSIGTGLNGRVLLKCFVGCSTEDVVAALGLQMSDLFEHSAAGNPIRRFSLVAPNGKVVATHVREDIPGDKILHWESNGKRTLNGTPLESLPLYRLPDVLAADESQPVIVCEGEKAADALADLGLLAVGTVTGADGTPCEASLAALGPHEVWLWPDNDEIGQTHMQHVAERLTGSVRWIDWHDAPAKGDAADYVAQGGTAVGIQKLLRKKAAPVPRGPRLSIVRMSDVQPEPIEWLWRGRLARGKPTLIMGDPGLGKSLITHTIAATVSVGGDWPDGGSCDRGTAILFTIEDGLADTVAPRLIAAKADTTRVIAVRGVIGEDATLDERMFALTEHLDLLHRLIVEEHAIYVVMDPVTAYLGADVNAHKESEVRAVLGPLQMLCEQTRVALAMLMHLNKGSGVSALYRAVGSIAFPAVARVVLGVAPDPNDEEGKRRLLLPIKMNVGQLPAGIGYSIVQAQTHILPTATEEDQPPILVWDNEPVTVDAVSAMDRNGSPQEMGALEETKRLLVQILAEGRVSARDAADQLKNAGSSPSPTTLGRARKELGIKVRKEGFGGRWYWELEESPKESSRARIPENDSLDSLEPLNSSPAKEFKESIESKESKESLARAMESSQILTQPHVMCSVCGNELWPHEEAAGRHEECR